MRERTATEKRLAGFRALEQEFEDTIELIALAEEEADAETLDDAEKALAALQAVAAKRQLESLLSGEADGNDCFLEIHAGAGGTESQDWAEMLVRMYARWADAHGYGIEWLEESLGEEAGIKSTTLRINGDNAYGWLKTESGVHRLVRISPYDASSRRHTSFASAWVYPVVDDDIEIEIDESQVRVDTYRASGAGGQHVNKTDSAVRLTHTADGNRRAVPERPLPAQATGRRPWKLLRARLYEHELQKREAEAQAERTTAKTEIGWGHQIRSYVLHPYQMVKDLRTNVEKGNAQGVLDGDIDGFLEAALAAKIGAKREP